jgi:hypothetical protein
MKRLHHHRKKSTQFSRFHSSAAFSVSSRTLSPSTIDPSLEKVEHASNFGFGTLQDAFTRKI